MVICLLLLLAPFLANSFPGPPHLHPTVHFAPPWVANGGGWHDVAGAITHGGVHHIFQGTGWNHATSTDLVQWQAAPHGPSAIQETYDGMSSNSDPCSGFLTKDDQGKVCAGFRQCASKEGVRGFPSPWDVPLEVRCALDQSANLSSFSDDPSDADHFNYLFNVSFWRAIPYDPARPWKEESTGMWYQLLSMDACNNTDQRNIHGLTCPAGGRLVMWQSPALRGEKADWQMVGDVWTDNTTVLKDGFLSHEFVTIDFLGTMPVTTPGDGDVHAGVNNTMYFLNNVGGNGGGVGCCSGTTSYTVLKQPQGPGTPFVEHGPGQQMVDWGSFKLKNVGALSGEPLDLLSGTASRGLSMARTLGSEETDQVTKMGRRTLIGWTGPAPPQIYGRSNLGSAQSLPRDLFMDPSTSRLVQRFVPELRMLRNSSKPKSIVCSGRAGTTLNEPMGTRAVELIVSFPEQCAIAPAKDIPMCGFEVLGNGDTLHGSGTSLVFTMDITRNLLLLNGTTLGNPDVRAGPIPLPTNKGWTVHMIVDHSIVEVIVNDDTAFVMYVAPAANTAGNIRVFGCDGSSVDIWTLKDAQHKF